LLKIEGVLTAYGGIVAVRDVTIDVQDGAITALIGSNGAGKTTLLNTISGFLKPRRGKILFQERNLVGLQPHLVSRAGILHVPEGRQMLGPLTVRENLVLGRLASGNRALGMEKDFDSIYSLFPILKARLNQLAGSLSGGEQQMLAIGRALMGHPVVLLLDEPSLGLAPLVVKQLFQTFAVLNGAGLTIFLVEQNAKRALEVSHDTYVMERGSIVFQGTSRELRDNRQIISHYLGGKESSRE
jgi:branched-chain amino acid transport system ATP-binding protein